MPEYKLLATYSFVTLSNFLKNFEKRIFNKLRGEYRVKQVVAVGWVETQRKTNNMVAKQKLGLSIQLAPTKIGLVYCLLLHYCVIILNNLFLMSH